MQQADRSAERPFLVGFACQKQMAVRFVVIEPLYCIGLLAPAGMHGIFVAMCKQKLSPPLTPLTLVALDTFELWWQSNHCSYRREERNIVLQDD